MEEISKHKDVLTHLVERTNRWRERKNYRAAFNRAIIKVERSIRHHFRVSGSKGKKIYTFRSANCGGHCTG